MTVRSRSCGYCRERERAGLLAECQLSHAVPAWCEALGGFRFGYRPSFRDAFSVFCLLIWYTVWYTERCGAAVMRRAGMEGPPEVAPLDTVGASALCSALWLQDTERCGAAFMWRVGLEGAPEVSILARQQLAKFVVPCLRQVQPEGRCARVLQEQIR